MKRKKIIVLIIVLIVMSIIFVVVCFLKKATTPDKLIEKVINQYNKELFINSFPNFMKSDMAERTSQDKMEEFYKDVIGDKVFHFQTIFRNKSDLGVTKTLEEIIENEYEIGINVTDYQLIQIKYHEDFEEQFTK